MGHIFITFDAPFHCQPTALQSVGTPQIPLRIGYGLPIDLGVVPYIQ